MSIEKHPVLVHSGTGAAASYHSDDLIVREFVFSCKYAGGFTCRLNLSSSDTLDDMVTKGVAIWLEFCRAHNLIELEKVCRNIPYHIHDRTPAQIREADCPAYICGHESSLEDDKKEEV